MSFMANRFGRLEVGIVLLGAVVVGAVGAVAYSSLSTFSRNISLAGITRDIELRLGLSHLWLEESLGGDRTINVETQVFGNIDQASRMCRARTDGGSTRFGSIEPMPSGTDRTRLVQLCEGIIDFRRLTASRLRSAPSAAGTRNDQAYDTAFERLLALADADTAGTERQIRRHRDQLSRLGVGMVAVLASLFAATAVLIRRRRAAMDAGAREVALRQEREAHLATIVESSSDAIMSTSLAGEVLTWNAGATEMFGYTAEEMVGQSIRRIVDGPHVEQQEQLAEQVKQGRSVSSEGTRLRKDGTSVPVAVTVSPIRRDGAVVAMTGILRDITVAKELEHALERRAFYDGLTELPNRSLLHDRVTHSLERAARSGRQPAVILVDLDNFKAVNDSLGHGVGDKVLVEVGARLHGAVRSMDTVARLGGDEFVVMVEDPEPGAAIRAASRILDMLRSPTEAGGHNVVLRASAGIAIGEVGLGADELLSNADAAMYSAKAAGKGHWQVFAPEMHQAVLLRLQLTTDLTGAVDRHELFLVYQPIVDLGTGRMLGAEALVRWRHPVRGLVSPLDFIAVAEESGQISEIGEFVLRQALRQLSRCQRNDPGFYLTVNVSPIQFRRPDFVKVVVAALEEAHVDPHRLVLEITETGLMTDVGTNMATLAELRKSGVRIAIDDFGTGYSSISYLKRLPIDIVKIDKSLVDGVANEPGVWPLVRAIVGLIDAVGLGTVAEGIESSAQVAHLEALGCTRGQGFYFARPLSGADLNELVAGSATLPQPAPPASRHPVG